MVLFLSCFGQDNSQRGKKKLDKKMIGNPTNFTHTAHLGIGSISDDDTISPEDLNKLKGRVPTSTSSYHRDNLSSISSSNHQISKNNAVAAS
ncbi:hypothetical protein BB558_004578 [Smittium angustum]|uniref:CRIB domain-containing protein n=1 Tax=Smittium angustum TaxID=133377 RepID=A0A2U1IXZ0_SMIAN|nr:hypothetical protein BB558_006440 [Smittium angustum]PVZ99396.1 hypothetical protein BB558_004578 [Smittium angustum]